MGHGMQLPVHLIKCLTNSVHFLSTKKANLSLDLNCSRALDICNAWILFYQIVGGETIEEVTLISVALADMIFSILKKKSCKNQVTGVKWE